MTPERPIAVAKLLIVLLSLGTSLGAQESRQRTTTYLLALDQITSLQALLSAGDYFRFPSAPSAYWMQGAPMGAGAFDNGDGTLNILVGHGLNTTNMPAGPPPAKGSYVSSWTVSLPKGNQAWIIKNGADMGTIVYAWDASSTRHQMTQNLDLGTFLTFKVPASGSLMREGASSASRIFVASSENQEGGRVYAGALLSNNFAALYELPAFGSSYYADFSFRIDGGMQTIVAAAQCSGAPLDEATTGSIILLTGAREAGPLPIEQAGLHGSTQLHAIRIGSGSDEVAESMYEGASVSFDLVPVSPEELDASHGTIEGATLFACAPRLSWSKTDPARLFAAIALEINGTRSHTVAEFVFDNPDDLSSGGVARMVFQDPSAARRYRKVWASDLQTTQAGTLWLLEHPADADKLSRAFVLDPSTGNGNQVVQASPYYFSEQQVGFVGENEIFRAYVDLTEFVDDSKEAGILVVHPPVEKNGGATLSPGYQSLGWTETDLKRAGDDGQVVVITRK